jgi:carbon-monoxide dehydrogenase large subunit
LTGEDAAADKIGGLICGWMIHSMDGSPMKGAASGAGAGKGALCWRPRGGGGGGIAGGCQIGRRAHQCLLYELDRWSIRAQAPGSASQVHDGIERNTVFEWSLGNKEGTDAEFAKAAHVTKLEIRNNRLIPNAIEPRAAIGSYDQAEDSFTLYTTSQNPHVARLVISAFVGMAPEHKLRVIAPDVGGGFGSKIFIYAEEGGVPVGLEADRRAAGPVDGGAVGVLPGGRAWARPRDNGGARLESRRQDPGAQGAHHRQYGGVSFDLRLLDPDLSLRHLLSGQYNIPQIYCEVDAVYTNTAPVDAYRGAVVPRPPMWWSGWSKRRRASSRSTRRSSGGATSSPVPAPDAGHHGL